MKMMYIILVLTLLSCTSNEQSLNQELPSDGLHVEYYANGQTKMQGNMKDGKKDGAWQSFFEDGKKWSESSYKNGVLNGPTKVYYSTGILMYSGAFRDGKKAGQWTFYTKEGAIDYKNEY